MSSGQADNGGTNMGDAEQPSDNNGNNEGRRGDPNQQRIRCPRCRNKQHSGACWPLCALCGVRHHPRRQCRHGIRGSLGASAEDGNCRTSMESLLRQSFATGFGMAVGHFVTASTATTGSSTLAYGMQSAIGGVGHRIRNPTSGSNNEQPPKLSRNAKRALRRRNVRERWRAELAQQSHGKSDVRCWDRRA